MMGHGNVLNLYKRIVIMKLNQPYLLRLSLFRLQLMQMWNNNFPFFHGYFPFNSPSWLQFAPSYSIPVHTITQDNVCKVEDFGQKFEEESHAQQPQEEKKTEESIGKRVADKQVRPRKIKKQEKEDGFDKKRQKKNRNLPSIVCRFFITFLYQHSEPEKIFGVWSQGTNSIFQKCLKEVKKHIKNTQSYIRPNIIEQMCRGGLLGTQQSRLFRVFFKRFIKVELRTIVGMMSKLRKKEKLAYFKIGNKFLRNFLAPLPSQ